MMAVAFKNLMAPLLLLAAYVIVDTFFGSVAGTLAALILGGGELIYTRMKEKRYDKIVIYTTLVFCLSGIMDIYVAGTVVARLQPVILEFFICLLFGVLAFSPVDLLTMIPASYRQEMHIGSSQIKIMRRSMKMVFGLMCGHVMLACMALLYLPSDFANFIVSPLLYILLGGYFLLVFLRSRQANARMKNEEWLPIVNEDGDVTGKASRRICHSEERLLHPVVHLHIINEKGEIFLQKRSMKKDLLPGKWDTAVGGHIGVNEKVEEALKREAFEELGITDFEAHYMGRYLWESSGERELVFSFYCSRYDRIRIDNDEVDEGRFWKAEEIINGIRNQSVTPNFAHEYETVLNRNNSLMKTVS